MRPRLATGAAVAALLLGACGSETSSDSADTAAPATEAPPTDPPATDPPPTDPPATEPPPTEPPPTDPPPTEPPPTEPPPTEPPPTEAPTTTLPPAIVIGEPDADGVIPVSIDGSQLDPLYDEFVEGADPLFFVHTQQDDIFVGIELYTVFGDAWTGELGTFPADCTTHGICVYLDPDGVGPLLGGGPATGEVTVTQLEGSSIITLDSVTIVADDGQVYRMDGVTLGG